MTETETQFEVPELRRLRYFHGQLLGAKDFQREQEYFREKLKLRLRCLLGYGVVCGLLAEPVDGDRPKVRLTPGLGIDQCGNEVVVRHGCEVDLWEALSTEESAAAEVSAESHGKTVWVGVEYREQDVEPTRTVFASGCADTSDCEFGWTREIFKIRVTATEPEPDRRCETCCDGCDDCEHPVLWLARVEDVHPGRGVRRGQIDLAIRRPFGRRVPTVITGINWRHGHTYTVDDAQALLGTFDDDGGLVVRFSDDVRTDTLRRGVVDIQVIEGGAGRNAESWFMGGEFAGRPDSEFTRDLRFRQTTREVLQDDDRVLITVRTAFLLDRCCRPVDGTHVGGRVPYVGHRSAAEESSGAEASGDELEARTQGGCALPPSGIGPWTSGNGIGGDVFESWFFVKEGR